MPGSELDATQQSFSELELVLDGSLPSSQFLKAVKAFFDVLSNVADDATQTQNSVEWLVEVREGSAVVIAKADPKNIPSEGIPKAIQFITNGFHALESGQKERPRHFNDRAMQGVRDLGRLVERGISVKVGRERLSTQAVASVDAVLEASYTDYGTIEGRLESVSVRKGNRFTIYDDLTDNGVTCHFETDMIDEVIDAFEKRVSVWGNIRYRKDGTPVSIKVEGFRVFRERNKLPKIDEMIGLLGIEP